MIQCVYILEIMSINLYRSQKIKILVNLFINGKLIINGMIGISSKNAIRFNHPVDNIDQSLSEKLQTYQSGILHKVRSQVNFI